MIPCARKLGQTKAVLGGSWLAQFHVENTTKGNFIWFKLGLVFQPPLSEYGSNGSFGAMAPPLPLATRGGSSPKTGEYKLNHKKVRQNQ